MGRKVVTNSEKLIKIFKDTRMLSKTVFANKTNKSCKNTKIYRNLQPKPQSTDLSVINFVLGGTLEVGTRYTNRYHTALLNFADGKKPGGWPEYGCLTQEENLCRCTNLYEILISDKCDEGYYSVNKKFDNNGLCTNTVMYVPNVTIFKDDNTYVLKRPKFADIITCPAPSCKFASTTKAQSVYEERIEQIVLSAIENNVECLVLGAWGCGAFQQDPVLVAKAFVSILNRYSGYFRKVVFAIKGTPGWGGHDTSYGTFLDVFRHEYAGFVVEEE